MPPRFDTSYSLSIAGNKRIIVEDDPSLRDNFTRIRFFDNASGHSESETLSQTELKNFIDMLTQRYNNL